MISYLIGIDYKRTPLDIREKAYRGREDITGYWKLVNPGRTAILVTCNRIEIYGVADSLDEAEYFHKRFVGFFSDNFINAYVLYGDEDIFIHGVRLASGLESQLKGEFQIMRQLEAWLNKESFPKALTWIWKDIVDEARKIRQKAGLGQNAINIADLLFQDLIVRLKNRDKPRIMVIGTGKIAELIAERKPPSAYLAFVARKNHFKAEQLSRSVNGEVLPPEDISERLIDVDAVICATSSPHYVLTASHFNKARSIRRKAVYIYDLAVPQDVDPDVSKINFNVILDSSAIIDNTFGRDIHLKEKIRLAEQLVEETIDRYRRKNEYKTRCASQQTCYCSGQRGDRLSA